jgi:predicted MFS family arabinose efflux permease
MTYSLASPLVGKMYDQGLGGFKLITTGSGLVTLGFLSMGPFTRLEIFSGLWVTVASMGVQGIGFSLVYIGSLLTMMGELQACGLPETEQSKGMVSSLWTVAVCMGQAMGTTAGGLAWDWVGFEDGMLVEAVIIFVSMVLVLGIRAGVTDFSEAPGDEENIELVNN